MIWDKAAKVYDFFETIYNKKVYVGTGVVVASMVKQRDVVLECACGTGAITKYVAPKCQRIVASDFSVGMLRQASKNCRKYPNVVFKKADIMNLNCADNRFDTVIAGNVIHLVPDPVRAINELKRVVMPGGKIIIPTYINMADGAKSAIIKVLEKLGIDFKRQFDMKSYMKFFEDLGYDSIEYHVVEGRMPCAIAVIDC